MMRLLLVLAILPFVALSQAQVLISSTFAGEKSAAELQFQFGEEFRTGISMYSIEYLTTGTDGMPDTASGLVVLPVMRYLDKYSIVAYQHGTTDGPNDVPSTSRGLDQLKRRCIRWHGLYRLSG